MTVQHHPDVSTLMSYAAGALSEPFAIVVASHVEMCPACRSQLRGLNALGGGLMTAGPSAALADDALERALSRLDDANPQTGYRSRDFGAKPSGWVDLPGPLSRLIGGGSDAIAWRLVMPGAADCRFTFEAKRGVHTLRFLRADPGQEIPEHAHVGAELTMVLQGALRDGEHVYRAGDVSDLDEVGTHNPVADGDERCICVVAEEGPPRFTSAKIRALQKRIGI